ncbi:6592_t:CDS:2, partial [Racocetra fulgida]
QQNEVISPILFYVFILEILTDILLGGTQNWSIERRSKRLNNATTTVSLQETSSTMPIERRPKHLNIKLQLQLFLCKKRQALPQLNVDLNVLIVEKAVSLQEMLSTTPIERRPKHLNKTLSTTPILSRQHTPEISRSPSEASSTSILSDQSNSEVGITSFEVNGVSNQQNSETSTQALDLKPIYDVFDQPWLQCTADPIPFSQTYELESTSDLYEEQYPRRTSTFLDTTNQPFTLTLGPVNIFRQDVSVFEIATFVADHPEILSMANMIHQSKQRSWDQSSVLKEHLIREQSTLSQNQNKEQQLISESTLEELKCLFLRTRNPVQMAFDQLVATVLPTSKLADDDFHQLLEKSKAMFNEFCYTFNKNLKNLADEYIKNSRLSRYIDYDVTKKVLNKYLSNARESEFTEVTQNALKKFT